MLAGGIVLLWFGGAALFVAFMSGKTASLTTGTSKDGKPQGPKDMREVVGRVVAGVRAAQSGPAGTAGTTEES